MGNNKRMNRGRRSFSVRSASSLLLGSGSSSDFDDFDVQASAAVQARQDTESEGNHALERTEPSFSLSSFVVGQHKAVMDKLSQHMDFDSISVAATLQSLVEGNACQAIADVPREIKTYYDSAFASEEAVPADRSTTISSQTMDVEPREGVDSGETRNVHFGYCLVREYNRTVGDHPDVSDDGPPLTITWDYIQLPNIPVHYYEAKKKRRRRRRLEKRSRATGQPIPHIPNLEMTVPRIRGPARRELLWSEFDVPAEELSEAEDAVKKVAELREDSCSQSVLSEKTEELLQSAQRKWRRSFGLGGKTASTNNKDETAIYNATISSSSNSSSTTKTSSEKKRSSAGFAASLRMEALRRQMGGCVGVGPNSKYGHPVDDEMAVVERRLVAAGGPEPDGMGGWKVKPQTEDSPILFLGRAE